MGVPNRGWAGEIGADFDGHQVAVFVLAGALDINGVAGFAAVSAVFKTAEAAAAFVPGNELRLAVHE